MEDQSKRASELASAIKEATKKLKIGELSLKLQKLNADSLKPDFWNDTNLAQATMQQIAKLQNQIQPWLDIETGLEETKGLIELNDHKLEDELAEQLSKLEKQFESLKDELKLSGPYDQNDAIMSIYAGAGGTDAQDWAQMLLRMYTRYFEKNNFQVKVIDESAGEEAGIKSVTLEIKGAYVFGKLRSEHGVHRLVRLSPFNADNLRQTSFAKVEVIPLVDQSAELEIDEKDLKIDTFRSGGRGGQSVNTTDSAVRVTHLPTGITVSIQNERSQLQNKATAMTILRSKLLVLKIEQHKEKLDELKGPNQSAEWGNQIRNYVLHPYKQVKDLRTKHESSDPDNMLNGEIEPFIEAYLDYALKHQN